MVTLKLGSKGDDVKKLQQVLCITPADGIFGKDTESKVKEYQKKNGLTVDGIVGQETLKKLGIIKETTPKCVDSSVIYNPLSVHISKYANRPIKYLAIHFTGSSNSKPGRANSTKSTFEKRSASADFCIDDRDIVQFNPDLKNYYCWAVGDKKYTNNKGGGILYGKATNRNTISIEICSTCVPATKIAVGTSNHSGWYFTDATLNNAAKLAKILIKKYNIPLSNVVRHYDISGKHCPGIIGWNEEQIYNSDGTKTSKYSTSEKWLEFKNKLK